MNLKLSIQIAVAKSGLTQADFEQKHGFHVGQLPGIKGRGACGSCNTIMLPRLANAAGVPVSTFIKWGEE